MRAELKPGVHQIPPSLVPSGWRAAQLREVARTFAGGRLGFTKQQHYRSSGIPAFSAAGQDGFVDKAEFQDVEGVVLSAIGANCGRCFFAEGDWTTLANTQAIIPSSELDARYLFNRVNREDFWPRSGSAQPFIKPSSIGDCWLLLPSLSEQRRIAEILDTLDEAIRKTERVIAKLQQMKQGLLHELLTRGIDENGEFRNPERHPERFKDSPLGRIPREWEAAPLGSRFSVKGGKRLPAGHSYSLGPTNYRYLRVSDFYERDIKMDELESLTASTFNALRRYEICNDDLYVSIAGSIGRFGVFLCEDPTVRTILTENAARLANTAEDLSEFAALQANHYRVQRQVLTEIGSGGGVPKLALFRIEGLLFAWPDYAEQVRIAEIAAIPLKRIACEEKYLCKLYAFKQGLMDDLLTGRVRVRPKEAE